MDSNELYIQAKNAVFWKLENTLRGDAFLVKENKIISVEEKRARMKAVEEFAIYIRNFEENIRIIEEYKKLKGIDERD